MRSKLLLIGLVLIGVLLISGCTEQAGTSATQDTSSEPVAPKTEITAKGIGSEMVIAPSKDNVISGVVTITAVKVPSDTGVVGFSIGGGNIPEDPSSTNIALDRDSSDGWSSSLDTTQYDNGAYTIKIVAGSADFRRMLGSATAQVVIQN